MTTHQDDMVGPFRRSDLLLENFGENDKGVRITHLPTGTSLSCDRYKSVGRNKVDVIKGIQGAVIARSSISLAEWLVDDGVSTARWIELSRGIPLSARVQLPMQGTASKCAQVLLGLERNGAMPTGSVAGAVSQAIERMKPTRFC